MSIKVQLPDEITTEILSRLPVDSVIECKRVCKTWRSLINHPTFADTHTRNHLLRVYHSSSTNSDDDDAAVTKIFFLLSELKPIHRLFHQYGKPRYEFHFGKYINANDNQMGGGFKITKALSNIDEDLPHWNIIGSSNGLICLAAAEVIYIYNPSTSEYVNLVKPTFKSTSTSATVYNFYGRIGFGYHPYTNEYKVVVVFYYYYPEEIKLVRDVRVYALGSGTWRSQEEEIEHHIGHDYCTWGPGVLMNGALHWLRWIKNDNHYAIVSFDLADEKFRSNTIVPSVPAVAPSPLNTLIDLKLNLLEGCLCMTQHSMVSNSLDIWVMNNRDKSWTMKFRITRKKDAHEYYIPIARLGSKLLLFCKKSVSPIAFYDIETRNIDHHSMRDGLKYLNLDFNYNMVAAIPYVKSFVSLKALGEEGAKNAT